MGWGVEGNETKKKLCWLNIWGCFYFAIKTKLLLNYKSPHKQTRPRISLRFPSQTSKTVRTGIEPFALHTTLYTQFPTCLYLSIYIIDEPLLKNNTKTPKDHAAIVNLWEMTRHVYTILIDLPSAPIPSRRTDWLMKFRQTERFSIWIGEHY